jgi:hypothetical protein
MNNSSPPWHLHGVSGQLLLYFLSIYGVRVSYPSLIVSVCTFIIVLEYRHKAIYLI